MSITLPPLPNLHWHDDEFIALTCAELRDRDLEVAKCVLEAAAKVCRRYAHVPGLAAEKIESLGVQHAE